MSTWLNKWEPENEEFWNSEGSKIAWKTLWITTGALIFSFATWFIMSALVVKLNGIGFKFTKDELFWLAAMPGLSGGLLRIIHTFLILQGLYKSPGNQADYKLLSWPLKTAIVLTQKTKKNRNRC